MDEVAQQRLKENLEYYLDRKMVLDTLQDRRNKLASLPEVQEYLQLQVNLAKLSEDVAFYFKDLSGSVSGTTLVRDRFGKLFVISKYDVKEVDEAYL